MNEASTAQFLHPLALLDNAIRTATYGILVGSLPNQQKLLGTTHKLLWAPGVLRG